MENDKEINEIVKKFLQDNSPSQNLFIYDKRGVKFLKGKLEGRLVKDVYNEIGDELIDMLREVYNEGNYHTKMVIKDIIRKELKVKK